jgi:ABC-type lipoprotein export system ATPase subunit
MLVCRALAKSFPAAGGPLRVLAGASLELPAGARGCLLGASGSGKTTLLHLAAGLLRPDAGTVELAGALLAGGEEALAAIRRQYLGMVFQRAHLLPWLDALGNVRLGGADEAAARGLLERLGLAARLHHRPAALSVGERQRVALARALVHRPAVVLADEPTANLDEQAAGAVIAALAAAATAGAAVLIATHDRRLAASAEQCWRLANGSCTEETCPPPP